MKYPKRSQYKYAKSPYRIRNWPEYAAGLRVEVQLACMVLNTMTSLGMPDSYRVG
jgi:hypothetical protein